jgi:type VI secretion system protein ImpJ
MSLNNKIIWSEGLFLRPQHFQQQDRYHERNVQQQFALRYAFGYGLAAIQLDTSLLRFGKFGLALGSGIFQDGTVFEMPADGPLPDPLEIPDDCKDAVICIALPVQRPGMADTTLAEAVEAAKAGAIRQRALDQDVVDVLVERDSTTPVKVAQLNVLLQLKERLTSGYMSIAVARVIEKRVDGQVILDEDFVPVCLDVAAARKMREMSREIHGLLRHRAVVLAQRVAQPGAKGVAEFTDFLLLQLCNRYEPLFGHMVQSARVHPETLYREMLLLAGELTTFGRADRRCPEFPGYRHDELALSFAPLVEEIRRTLTAVLEQTAISIPLIDKGRGVQLAEVADISLLRSATFVLAVNADVPSEQIRNGFPLQLKLGPVEKIRDLVLSQLPGIAIRPLPVAPRQIPYHAGHTYFELDRDSELWKAVEISRVIAMHLSGEFSGLTMEFWAIRDR